MLSWAPWSKKKDGFIDSRTSAEIGTAGIASFNNTALSDPLFTKDMGLDIAGLTTTTNTRPSGVPNFIENARLVNVSVTNTPTALQASKKAGIPVDTFAARQSACEATGNGDQLDHLSNLAGTQDPSSNMRCGWVYNNNNPANGRGAYGTVDGPFQTSANGQWMWDLTAAQKKYHTQICDEAKNCQDIDASRYGGRCGWNTLAGKAVPIKNGLVAYPNDPRLSCSSANLVSSGSRCPPPPPPTVIIDDNGNSVTVHTPASICTPLANGHLSRSCIIQKVQDSGCSDKGTLVNALRGGSDSNYIDQLSRSKAYTTYQTRAVTTLDATSLQSGGYQTTAAALNDFQRVNDLATSAANQENGLGYAARDLCFKQGELDKFDFCTELKDNDTSFDLDCVQKAFLKAGGQRTGRQYPTQSSMATTWKLDNWKAVKDKINTLMNKARAEGFTSQRIDPKRLSQEQSSLDAYGIGLESKSVIPTPSIPQGYSGPRVVVREHCDNFSGWKQELAGLGTFRAGSDFPGGSSYIVVPGGLMAVLTASNGSTQTVLGPGEFNFCSRPGFNDAVVQIQVGGMGTTVRGGENVNANLQCDSGSIGGLNYKYGQWPNGSFTEKLIPKSQLPSNCGGNTQCTIPLGNNWGDPMHGTYKKYEATPLCSDIKDKYEYKGCWGDSGNPNSVPPNGRALPKNLAIGGGNIKSIEDCYGLAAANGYDTFGNQYYGECWAGKSAEMNTPETSWRRYGGLDEDRTCGEIGTGGNNKVYSILPTTRPLDVQTVYGNNGSVSCETYCRGTNGGPWNGELPRSWNGARCIGAPNNPGLGCNSGFNGALTCTCKKTGTGWN